MNEQMRMQERRKSWVSTSAAIMWVRGAGRGPVDDQYDTADIAATVAQWQPSLAPFGTRTDHGRS